MKLVAPFHFVFPQYADGIISMIDTEFRKWPKKFNQLLFRTQRYCIIWQGAALIIGEILEFSHQ